MNSARITVRLDPKTERRLKEEALASGKNESEVVRDVLAAHFSRSPKTAKALEVARRCRGNRLCRRPARRFEHQ